MFLISQKSCGYKSNHQIDQQTKSIFSNKKYKETITPARYKGGNKNIELVQPENVMSEQYFPEMEYPTNIMEASRPFFYKPGDSNTILGPFPDDVRSSYKSLLGKNKKPLEEIKAKYMNDFTLNARNCLQENTVRSPRDEQIVVKSVTVLKENADELVDDSVELKKEKANVPPIDEEIVVKEIEMTNITSESHETIEDEAAENSETKSPATNYIEEEEIIAQDLLQSWESEQFFSKEITDDRSQGDDLDHVLETLTGSEEILEEIDNSS